MSQQQKSYGFGLLTAVLLFLAYMLGDYSNPQSAWAADVKRTDYIFGNTVTASTSSTLVLVPGGRGGAFFFEVDATGSQDVYIKLATPADGSPTATSSDYHLIVSPGESVYVNQHTSRGFAYATASSTESLEYFVTHS